MDIFLVLIVAIAILSFANALLLSISDIQANVTKTQTFEAAFQGRCNDKTPCQQLCVQSHDGTYECACRKSYQLSLDGYTCNHINSELVQLNLTVLSHNNTEELAYRDVFYQSAAIISASLEKDTTNSTKEVDSCSINCGPNAYCYQDDSSRVQLCKCKFGFSGSNCNQKIEISIAKLNENGWIQFAIDSNNDSGHLDVEFQVRPESYDGLLLWLNLNKNHNSTNYQNAYVLFLKNGFLNFWIPNGSTIAKMQSNAKIVLKQWNLIKLFCYQSFGRLQLNDDIKTTNLKNKSKQISRKSEFYIGGIREDLKKMFDPIDNARGFSGCFKHVRFNNFKYLFNKADNNYAPIDGLSVDECTEETCLNNDLCQNSGLCKLIYNEKSGGLQPKCYCHFGNYGDSCEQVMQSHILSFDYNSFFIKKQLAPYFNDNRTRHHNYLEIDFEIRPQQLSGSVLYGLPYMTYYYQANFDNCLFGLFLDNGFLEFVFKSSTNSYRFRTNETLSVNHWHRINIYQNSHIIYLRINHSDVYTFIKDNYQVNSRLLLPEKLIFGRIQTSTSRTSQLKHLYSFKGNLKHIRLNNKPVTSNGTFQDICIDNCEKVKCQGAKCQSPNKSTAVPFIPQFRASRNSYIFSNDTDLLEQLNSDNYQINLRLKTTSINGLILFYNYKNRFLSIEVIDRFLVTRISIQDGFLIAQSNSFEISDNLWHRLEIYRQNSKLRIKIDNKQMTTKQSLSLVENLNVSDWYFNHGLYIGGQETSTVYRNLNGCLFDIVFNSYVTVPLMTGCNKIAYCTEH